MLNSSFINQRFVIRPWFYDQYFSEDIMQLELSVCRYFTWSTKLNLFGS